MSEYDQTSDPADYPTSSWDSAPRSSGDCDAQADRYAEKAQKYGAAFGQPSKIRQMCEDDAYAEDHPQTPDVPRTAENREAQFADDCERKNQEMEKAQADAKANPDYVGQFSNWLFE